MASSYGLCVHPGTLLCKVLEQMSMINFMNYFLVTTAEGFVPSHAPLKNNKHLNIPFQSTQPRRGKDKSELQGLTPPSRDRAYRMRRGVWGRASILSVMPNVAPDNVWLFVTPWIAACHASLSLTISWSLPKFKSIASVMPFSHLILWKPSSPSALNLSQHQGLFQWVGSSHQVDKVLELQL